MAFGYFSAIRKKAVNNRQPCGTIGRFAFLFVHGKCGGKNPRVSIRNLQPFKYALNTAILTPPPMQGVKDDIGAKLRQTKGNVRTSVQFCDIIPFAPQSRGTFAPR